MLSCSIWFCAPSFWTTTRPKTRCRNRMLQLNIWCSWWWPYVPETCRAKNTSIKLPWCMQLECHIISRKTVFLKYAFCKTFAGTVRRGEVWCGVLWCGVVCCGVVRYGVVWCGEVRYGVVWWGMVWCSVVCWGMVVVWCGVVCVVVWCDVVQYTAWMLEINSNR